MKRLMFVLCAMAASCAGLPNDNLVQESAPVPPSSGLNSKLTKAEQFVLEKLSAGDEADLSSLPDTERTLHAKFFEDLLTGKFVIHWRGVQIRHAVFNEPIDLSAADVSHEIGLTSCTFQKAVNLGSVRFAKTLSIEHSKFYGALDLSHTNIGRALDLVEDEFYRDVIFASMEVADDAYLSRAIFHGQVNFTGADIKKEFDALYATFLSKGMPTNPLDHIMRRRSAIFNVLRVGTNFVLDHARFLGPVDFRDCEVGKRLILSSAEFKGTDLSTFEGLRAELVRLDNSVFSGEADLSHLHIEGNANFDNTEFAENADFNDTEISGQLTANNAKFRGKELHFERVKIGGDGYFIGAHVFGKTMFLKTTVGGKLDLSDSEFQGDLSVDSVQVGDFIIESTQNKPLQLTVLQLDRSMVQHQLVLYNVEMSKLWAQFLKATGTTTFRKVKVSLEVNLERSQFQSLDEFDIEIPNRGDDAHLNEMSYQQLGSYAVSQLPQIFKRAGFSRENYAALESYWKSRGDGDAADNIFVQMRRREREKLGPLSRIASWVLEKLVKYGREAERAFYAAFAVIVFGTIVFWRRTDVKAQRAEDESRYYNPFWYSFDLLVPAIDLQAASVWVPRQDSRFRQHYARVHRILGWILIPVGLAAVTGIIR